MASFETYESSSDDDEVEFEVEQFKIAGYEFGITTVAFMPITKLLKLNQTATEISGQKVWCGSLGIAELMLAAQDRIMGKHVVELGAGTGILGMLCMRLGAARVCLTDHDERSLEHMRADCPRNNVDAHVMRLDWFTPSLDGLDLTGDAGGLVVIAGDVVYKTALVEPFMRTVALLLASAPGSVFYLCHIPRGGPRVEHALVEEGATAQGLAWEILSEESWKRGSCLDTNYVPPEDVNRARVYMMRVALPGDGVGAASK